jgi:hypothetical protein
MKVTQVTPVVAIPKHKANRQVLENVKPITKKEWMKACEGKEVSPAVIMAVSRLDKPYEGGDALMEWHREKTKSSLSEASRDADYATPIWRCKNDWDRTKEYLGWIAVWVLTLGAFYVFASGFEKWVSL